MISIDKIAGMYNNIQKEDTGNDTIEDDIYVTDFDAETNACSLFWHQHCFATVNTNQKTTIVCVRNQSLSQTEFEFLSFVKYFKGYVVNFTGKECAKVINSNIEKMLELLNVITQNYSCMLQNKMQEVKEHQSFDTDDASSIFNLTRMIDRCDQSYKLLPELKYFDDTESESISE